MKDDFYIVKRVPNRSRAENYGLTGRKKWLIINNKKWVFTVHLVTACSFLFYCQNIIQIFSAIFSMVNQKTGMEEIVSDKR